MLIEPLQHGSFPLRRVSRPAYVFQAEYFSDRLTTCLKTGGKSKEVSRTFNPGFIANHRAYIELRFKSLNAFIHRLGFRQVLEFAGGVAARGFILSVMDPIFWTEK